jgi:hypothetical protein
MHQIDNSQFLVHFINTMQNGHVQQRYAGALLKVK